MKKKSDSTQSQPSRPLLRSEGNAKAHKKRPTDIPYSAFPAYSRLSDVSEDNKEGQGSADMVGT